MNKLIDFPTDEDSDDEPCENHSMNDWSEDIFREYCNTSLTLIGTAVDATNEEVSDIKRNINRIRQELDDDFEEIYSLRENVESQRREMTRLKRSFTHAAAFSAALLSVAAIASAVLCKRR